MDEELRKALIDVRRAYRLIYLYQRSALDTIKKIAEEFGNCRFYCWAPVHYERPTRLTTTPLDGWAWDMLPMYDFSVLFLSDRADPNRQSPNDWLLEIRVVADDGYNPQGLAEPDPTKFNSPDNCGSYIKLCFSYCARQTEFNWYSDTWERGTYPQEDQRVVVDSAGLRTISQTYDMANMHDETSIVKNVNEFKELLRSKLQLNNI